MKVLIEGFKKCFEDEEFKKLAHDLGLPLDYRDPQGFEAFLKEMEETLRPALESVGLLKEKK
jgi:tripartite-type tricarboxylate transporter receptor subunit TctC